MPSPGVAARVEVSAGDLDLRAGLTIRFAFFGFISDCGITIALIRLLGNKGGRNVFHRPCPNLADGARLCRSDHTAAVRDIHVKWGKIINGLAALSLFRREGDVEIKIEICLERGEPLKPPTHALLERRGFFPRRAGNDGERRVALSDVKVPAVEMVGPKEAMLATFLPARPEHEVIDDQLALAAEQLAERLSPEKSLRLRCFPRAVLRAIRTSAPALL